MKDIIYDEFGQRTKLSLGNDMRVLKDTTYDRVYTYGGAQLINTDEFVDYNVFDFVNKEVGFDEFNKELIKIKKTGENNG